MSDIIEDINFWLVGSKWDDIDKTDYFIDNGIWINGFDDKYQDRVNSVNIGDKIAIKASYVKSKKLPFNNQNKSVSVMKIKTIGEVVNNPKNGKEIKVLWDKEFKSKEIYGFSYRNTISIIDKEKWSNPIEWIFNGKEQDDFFSFNEIEDNGDDEMPNEIKQNQPLNQILYGPPGTGKTYNTINKALEIIYSCSENEILQKIKDDTNISQELKDIEDERDRVKKVFEYYKEQGQIEFVTFHQSYGYEEFVEGIKAKTNEESKEIEYQVESGIFKRLSELAKQNKHICLDLQNINFQKYISVNQKFQTLTGIKFEVINVDERIRVRNSQNKEHSLSRKSILDYLEKQDFENTRGHFSYQPVIAKYIFDNLKTESIEDNTNKNYVLIIDEINRGNISKIFGELMTLIEDSKRLGETEQVEITLPYSGEKFSVPQNLYIIGTMNTADRSIAPIDTALRRRFVFEEMAPKASLLSKDIEGVNLQKLLEAINTRIEYLYDRDHTIGHAYLIDVQDLSDLRFAFKNKIIPLLAEYFYEDWENIDLVLNSNGFIVSDKENQSYLSDKIKTRIQNKITYKVSDKNWEVGNFEKIYNDNVLSQTDEPK